METIDKLHDHEFLWLEEVKLVHHIMSVHENAFAWDECEKGCFKHEYFPPVEFPVIEHVPWRLPVLPIPPGLLDQIVEIVKDKISAGVYEPSSSSYRSRWFTVLKKDGKSLRIVHDLQPLNAVSIRDSSIPPMLEQLGEWYACRSVLGQFNIFIGYDHRSIAISLLSRHCWVHCASRPYRWVGLIPFKFFMLMLLLYSNPRSLNTLSLT